MSTVTALANLKQIFLITGHISIIPQ